ncbi:MAG TPA: MarR family transcriptional regulator [Acidimicrobiales bacterium]|nr:MarR family transcriptional regulator [Acidimicrobiales bacterium]
MPADDNAADRAAVAAAVRTLARLSRLLERGGGDLSLPQFRLLAMVERGQRASFLAHKLTVAKPTVTALVDGLVERGYVSRSQSPDDKRATDIALTPAGRKALKTAEADMAERLEGLLDRTVDRRAVLDALADLHGALEDAFEARLKAGARA